MEPGRIRQIHSREKTEIHPPPRCGAKMDEKMKTGVEIIADRRAAIASVSRAQMESVFSIAAAIIAAEIDRINKLFTK